ncbi:MAG: hypothetical protein WBP26_05635 [Candidatus Saccharimonadales bacterium]
MNKVFQVFADNGLDVSSLPQAKPAQGFDTAFNIVIATMAVIAVLIIVLAGFKYITSAGDPQSVAGARKAIIYAVVGLIIMGMAYSIVAFVIRGV